MKYLVTTDPRAEAQEIEAPCGSAAVTEVLGTSHGDRDHVTVYVRPQRPQEWDVFLCVRHGASWSAPFLGSMQVAGTEVDRLRAELREVREVRDRMRDYHDAERAQWQNTLRAERERVREACLSACKDGASVYGDPYDELFLGRLQGADGCTEIIAALDLDALSENDGGH